MLPQWIIEKKRDGAGLSEEEIRFFIDGYTRGDIPDYQMSALAMAIFFRGMEFDEVATLTDAMMRSGDEVDTSSIALPKADKHSTGGIGDKVSLILAPLVACCDVAVPMMSGRGLGITGGTLDKLEAIPGYRADLSQDEFLSVLQACGCAIIGQTASLAPADKKLYALRDVTGTVPSIPLISSSIMSKKLAEGTDALVLDVKWGHGAFMKTADQARELARTMVEIGVRMGKRMAALVTDMNEPLGRTAGNAVEVAESVATLRGDGPEDLTDLTIALGARMLLLSDRADDTASAEKVLRKHIASGAALERFRKMIELQGGDSRVADDPSLLTAARLSAPIPAPRAGYVADINADTIGRTCLVLGAGRCAVTDDVDHAVGITGMAKSGERVAKGDPLAILHANSKAQLDEAAAMVAGAFAVNDAAPPERVLVQETILPDAEAT